MEATKYRHIANKTVLRAPELRPGDGLGMVSQLDHPAHSSWVTMDLLENEETGLEEILGLDCDGLDESAMTLQMRVAHDEERAEEVRLLPGTYRQLAYAETISPTIDTRSGGSSRSDAENDGITTSPAAGVSQRSIATTATASAPQLSNP
jgi:hypothetical protein